MVKITKSLSFMASAACLSTMLFMSSCSKEDAVMPSPEFSINEGANQKANLVGSGYGITPFGIPPTIGQPGIGLLPVGYTKYGTNASSAIVGLSTSQYLFGNSSTPWLPASNATPIGAGTFLTLGAKEGQGSNVSVKVKKLTPGRPYKFTFYISTMAVKSGLGQTPYGRSFSTFLKAPKYLSGASYDLLGQENQWITKTIPVPGGIDEIIIKFSSQSNAISYGNIFIPENAIQPDTSIQ